MSDPTNHFPDVAPWPGEKPAEAPAPIGHNKPPLEEQVPADFRAALIERKPEFDMLLERWSGAAERAIAIDDETLSRCGDVQVALRALGKIVTDAHTEVKEPFLTGGRLVDALKRDKLAKLEAASTSLQIRMNTFTAKRQADHQAAEMKRLADEREASRLADLAAEEAEFAQRTADLAARRALMASGVDEVAAAAAAQEAAAAQQRAAQAAIAAAPVAAAAPPPTLVRSDAGASVGTRTVWNSRVDDLALAFASVSDDPSIRVAIEKVVAKRVKAGMHKIPGCTIWNTAAAVARG